jgi:hypothetical protein
MINLHDENQNRRKFILQEIIVAMKTNPSVVRTSEANAWLFAYMNSTTKIQP